ncbi:oligosaccharide flippase family protein [Flavobacterium sp. MK4S-17]|uniref:oligosaccharide flippase family protein n=1 Tax=Flavobacterium sp. MK4S-17 TaxID=2543737 RepID=UPI001F169012|nr:oligosaccharide flippase family protein [Flavobacterium sp. MK4S-17]
MYSIINYIGTAIGVVSTLLIYPKDKVFLGTVRYVENIAQLLYPVMVLGASHALIKFYPTLDEQKKRQLFNYSLASISVISIIVFSGILLYGTFAEDENSMLFFYAFPVAVSLAFIELFRKQAQDLQKLAVPTLFEKIIPKVVLPLLFIALFAKILGVFQSLFLYALAYIIIFLITGMYLFRHYKPGFNYRFSTLFGSISRKDYFRYSLYAFAGSIGSLLAFRIDGIFIFNLISEEANGTFNIGVNLASTLQIPAIGMFALYAPIISGYLQDDNFTDLNVKYKETARLLFFIGAVFFSCVVLGVEDLFRLLPTYEQLKGSIPVIFILGFSVLINMATGFNTEIITYSKYYKFNMVAILTLVGVNIALNLLFIYHTDLGFIGVAIASFISMTLFNLSKLIFIYKKFRLLPFDAAFFKLAAVFALSGVLCYFLPGFTNPLADLVFNTGLSLTINITTVYRLRLVYQVNVWIDKVIDKFKR